MPSRFLRSARGRQDRFEAFLLWLNRDADDVPVQVEPGVTEIVRAACYRPAVAQANFEVGKKTLRRMLRHAHEMGLITVPGERASKSQHARALGYWILMPHDLASKRWREAVRMASASFRGNQRRRIEHARDQAAEDAAREQSLIEQADRDPDDGVDDGE